MPQEDPRKSEHHDVLVVTPKHQGRLFRVPVEKTGPAEGEYLRAPATQTISTPGTRKVLNIADPYPSATEPQRGPALSTLPVNPDPSASSFNTCFLLNLKNLAYKTPWTAEEWNDSPPNEENVPQQPELDTRRTFDLVVGAPDGSAYLISQTEATQGPAGRLDQQPKARFSHKLLDLQIETEVWSMLRNGCVAGSVRLQNGKIVPLVNVASLQPPPRR